MQAGLPWESDEQPAAWEDRTPAVLDSDSDGSDAPDAEPERRSVPSTSGRRPVWDDPDDLSAQVNIAAQPLLRKLRKTEQDGIVSGAFVCTKTRLCYCPAQDSNLCLFQRFFMCDACLHRVRLSKRRVHFGERVSRVTLTLP